MVASGVLQSEVPEDASVHAHEPPFIATTSQSAFLRHWVEHLAESVSVDIVHQDGTGGGYAQPLQP
jgi:hypothetical protein